MLTRCISTSLVVLATLSPLTASAAATSDVEPIAASVADTSAELTPDLFCIVRHPTPAVTGSIEPPPPGLPWGSDVEGSSPPGYSTCDGVYEIQGNMDPAATYASTAWIEFLALSYQPSPLECVNQLVTTYTVEGLRDGEWSVLQTGSATNSQVVISDDQPECGGWAAWTLPMPTALGYQAFRFMASAQSPEGPASVTLQILEK